MQTGARVLDDGRFEFRKNNAVLGRSDNRFLYDNNGQRGDDNRWRATSLVNRRNRIQRKASAGSVTQTTRVMPVSPLLWLMVTSCKARCRYGTQTTPTSAAR